MIVVEGKGCIVLEGTDHVVKPHLAAFINPGAHHSTANHAGETFKIAWNYASIDWSTVQVE